MEKDLESLRTRVVINFDRVLSALKDQQFDDITAWILQPNPAFRGFPPIDLLFSDYGTEILLEHIESWGTGSID